MVKGKPNAGMVITYTYQNTQQPGEQQTSGGMTQPDQDLWVINSTGCIWDADDNYKFIAKGTLEPGESFTVSRSVICDWTAHLVGITATGGKRESFEVSLSFSDGHCISPAFLIGKRYQDAKGCMSTPDYDHASTKLSPIPDSNGGIGQEITKTWTITNTGQRRSKTLWLTGEIGLNTNYRHERYCSCPFPLSIYGTCEGIDPKVCWCE